MAVRALVDLGLIDEASDLAASVGIELDQTGIQRSYPVDLRYAVAQELIAVKSIDRAVALARQIGAEVPPSGNAPHRIA